MDLVSLTHYCSHVLVTNSTKVKVNHQNHDHDHHHDDHHHHLDRLDAWSSSINYQSQLSGIKSFLWQLLQPHTMYFPLKLLSFSIASIIIIIIIIIIEIIAIGIIFIHLHCMITPIKNDALSLKMIISSNQILHLFFFFQYISVLI